MKTVDEVKEHYQSGETVEAGDFIRWHGDDGIVLFVVGDLPADDWYRQEFGHGAMLEVQGAGRVLEQEIASREDIEFVDRKG